MGGHGRGHLGKGPDKLGEDVPQAVQEVQGRNARDDPEAEALDELLLRARILTLRELVAHCEHGLHGTAFPTRQKLHRLGHEIQDAAMGDFLQRVGQEVQRGTELRK